MCYRCFWPQPLCWCGSITPMETRTRFVFLMHPKEFKDEKAATGRLTHLCLTNSEVRMGIEFDAHDDVQALIRDPQNFPVLLYPGREAIDLSAEGRARPLGAPSGDEPFQPSPGEPSGPALPVGSPAVVALAEQLRDRRLVVFILDATWALGRKMLRLSPSLQRLPRIMFTPTAPSRYVIKQQPHAGCLSTLEATHELLVALERAGLDDYALPEQLLGLFARMQEFQMRCAADPTRGGYRRSAYTSPDERVAPTGRSGARRTRVFQAPETTPVFPPAK